MLSILDECTTSSYGKKLKVNFIKLFLLRGTDLPCSVDLENSLVHSIC